MDLAPAAPEATNIEGPCQVESTRDDLRQIDLRTTLLFQLAVTCLGAKHVGGCVPFGCAGCVSEPKIDHQRVALISKNAQSLSQFVANVALVRRTPR